LAQRASRRKLILVTGDAGADPIEGDPMKRFFDLTFKPFFVVTGIGTASASLYAFWPRWAAETAGKIPFVADYTIITQHWGIMVGLMGVFMIVAGFKVEWRKPILIYSLLEKAFMVYLVLANSSHSYAQGFKAGAAMDATVVLYTIVYFAVSPGSEP
jgi:hypothetical protein